MNENKIFTSKRRGKISYRKNNEKNIRIEDDCEEIATQTESAPLEVILGSEGNKSRQKDLEEFKRFTHGETLSLKAELTNRPKSPTMSGVQDREALIRNMEERILSLERQIHQKKLSSKSL